MEDKTFFLYLKFIDGNSFKEEGNNRKINQFEKAIHEEDGFIRIYMNNGMEMNYRTQYLVSYAISPSDLDEEEKFEPVKIGFTE